MAWVVSRFTAVDLTAFPTCCHIILQDPLYKYEDGLPKTGWHDTIVIGVDDIVKPIYGYLHFTSEMAKQLADFIKKNDGKNMLINCDAGISRSSAVGSVLRDYFGYEVKFFCGTDEHRNVLIRSELIRALGVYGEQYK